MKKAIFNLSLAIALSLLLTIPASSAHAYSDGLVIMDDAGLFNYYRGDSLNALLGTSQTVGWQGADSIMADVTDTTPYIRTKDFELFSHNSASVCIFQSQKALKMLDASQRGWLADQAKQGNIILGIAETDFANAGGNDRLVNSFGLLGKDYGGEPSGEGFSIYLTNGTEDGVRDDYFLGVDSSTSLGAAWTHVMNWAGDQLSTTRTAHSSGLAGVVPQDAPLADRYTASEGSYDPWLATFTIQYARVGDYGDISTGISFYKLDTTSEEHDWYRVDEIVKGTTTSYTSDGAFYANNYIWQIDHKIYQREEYQYYSDTYLWDNIPETTQTDSTVTYELGANLGCEVGKDPKIKGDISVGYSKSYDCHEVDIYDYTSHAGKEGKWTAEVAGVPINEWLWEGFEPSNTAKSSYTYEPSTIWKIKKGAPFEYNHSSKLKMKSAWNYVLWMDVAYWTELSWGSTRLLIN